MECGYSIQSRRFTETSWISTVPEDEWRLCLRVYQGCVHTWCPITSTGVVYQGYVHTWCPITSTGVVYQGCVHTWCPITSTGVVYQGCVHTWCPITSTGVVYPVFTLGTGYGTKCPHTLGVQVVIMYTFSSAHCILTVQMSATCVPPIR